MDLVIEPRPYTDADVVRLVAEVQAVYVEMYGGPDEAVVTDDEFVLPNGELLVALVEGEPVAMGGWRRLDAGTAEIKRMYTSPGMQRQGIGRRMLRAVEASARAAGIDELVLNTGPHQDAAIELYKVEGYAPSAPFGHYADFGEALFFAKDLAPLEVS
ncbi:GNAT family N-acetyltransferase [Jatrophihabitans fulvus]